MDFKKSIIIKLNVIHIVKIQSTHAHYPDVLRV